MAKKIKVIFENHLAVLFKTIVCLHSKTGGQAPVFISITRLRLYPRILSIVDVVDCRRFGLVCRLRGILHQP